MEAVRARDVPDAASAPPALADSLSFDAAYEDNVDMVWRTLRRLGVSASQLDDAVQDVFLIVHRKLDQFVPTSSVRSWLAAIAVRVASDYRRRARRKDHKLEPLSEALEASGTDPQEAASNAEALRRVTQALDELSTDRRAVFVLAELEQLTAPEIAEALGLKLNTVYSRLRAARLDFEQAIHRYRGGFK